LTTPQPSGVGPVPIAAEVFGEQLVVTFDQELLNTSLDPNNWTMRLGGNRFECSEAVVNLTQVECMMDQLGPEAGPDVCNYAAIGQDVRALDGTPAAAFSDFPIT